MRRDLKPNAREDVVLAVQSRDAQIAAATAVLRIRVAMAVEDVAPARPAYREGEQSQTGPPANARRLEAIVERDIPALRKDAEHLIQHFGEVSANQMMLDTVQALAADIQGEDGKSMSTIDKLGNIQYALHRALVDNRNFIQQDSFKAFD